MSGLPCPMVRKPKPLVRLNHLTTARSSPLSGETRVWVRAGGSSTGWGAVLSSMDRMRKACRPRSRATASTTIRAPSRAAA